MTRKEQESNPKPRGQLKGSRLELRMYCCRVEDPHPPSCCTPHHAQPTPQPPLQPMHKQSLEPFSPTSREEAGSMVTAGPRGARCMGWNIWQRRGRPLMYAPQRPPSTSLSGPCSHHSRTGSCSAGGSELWQLTYAHTNTSPLLDQIGWGTTCYSPLHPPTPADQGLQLCERLVFPAP